MKAMAAIKKLRRFLFAAGGAQRPCYIAIRPDMKNRSIYLSNTAISSTLFFLKTAHYITVKYLTNMEAYPEYC